MPSAILPRCRALQVMKTDEQEYESGDEYCTTKELLTRFDAARVEDLKARRLKDGKWKAHPDFPTIDELKMYKTASKISSKRKQTRTHTRKISWTFRIDPAIAMQLAGDIYSVFPDLPDSERPNTIGEKDPKKRKGVIGSGGGPRQRWDP